MIITSAPAKIILFGEHAVVYGQPAIAAPVSSLRTTAQAEANPPDRHGLHIALPSLPMPVAISAAALDEALMLTVELTLKALHVSAPDVTIHIRSDIPVASGLGSGAAVSAALVRAVGAAVGTEIDDEKVNAIVYEVEKIHHGSPSGIDNTVIVYERPIFYVKGHPIETFAFGVPLRFLIADTGVSASTKIAVRAVRTLYEVETARIGAVIGRIGAISVEARQRMQQVGALERIGELMDENHALLRVLTVSSDQLDHLTNAARTAGAFGAKLSGGGRGGNLIALVDAEREAAVQRALIEAGAHRVLAVNVG